MFVRLRICESTLATVSLCWQSYYTVICLNYCYILYTVRKSSKCNCVPGTGRFCCCVYSVHYFYIIVRTLVPPAVDPGDLPYSSWLVFLLATHRATAGTVPVLVVPTTLAVSGAESGNAQQDGIPIRTGRPGGGQVARGSQVKSSRWATHSRSEHPDPNFFLPPPLLYAGSGEVWMG